MEDLEIFSEAALSDSFIFKAYNGNGELTSMLINGIKNSIVIDDSYIQEQLLQISRTRISPIADKVLKARQEGKLVLLYARDTIIPEMVPYFITKTKDGVKAYIFINRYGTITKSAMNSADKYLNISMKDMYSLLEGAYISYIYATTPIKITKSISLMKTCSYIYTYMFIRILNKEYGISMDQNLYNRVIFSLGKFFLKTVWGCENMDLVNAYAKANIKNLAIDMTDLTIASKMYDDANITNISELFAFLKTLSPRMATINTRYMIQSFITMYKAPALLGCESLQYFLFIVQSSMIGAYIVNAAMVLDVIKGTPGMNMFYSELTKCTM